jgi:glycosyltransferase involved in cell wall biosynthesis
VTTSLLAAPGSRIERAERIAAPRVLVACPDARPPAYEAVAGFAHAQVLDRFLTGFYYRGASRLTALARQWAPCRYRRWRRVLMRRHHRSIPKDLVRSDWAFDVALAMESRLARRFAPARRRLARWRTRHFDSVVARAVKRHRPDIAFVFSDVASELGLPASREAGTKTILSMVHGDVREEREVLAYEAEFSPDFFPLYLADGPIDTDELDWLHKRRLRDIALADRILVPSQHIADALVLRGTSRENVTVIPYAADTVRFRPLEGKRHGRECTFLFAGGITQRKGIKYLLEAWRAIRRPGWRLQLLGALPGVTRPLEPYLNDVELLGRVSHSEVGARMAAADVFVFPSLFEGSAVVTYEALACGLPTVVTPAAGSVVRDRVEGFVVAERDVTALAEALEQVGADPELRAEMGHAARLRAESFTWERYQASLLDAVRDLSLGGAGLVDQCDGLPGGG